MVHMDRCERWRKIVGRVMLKIGEALRWVWGLGEERANINGGGKCWVTPVYVHQS